MNLPVTTPVRETEILKDTLQCLENQGLVAVLDRERPALGRTRADALIRLGYAAEGETIYAAEIKRWLTPANLGAVAA